MLAPTLKRLRAASRLTLQQLSERSGVSISTLSKIENGQLSPTYEKIAALASGLGVEVGELFGQNPKPTPLGRRSVTRAGDGAVHETDQYRYEAVNADLPGKRFVPLVTTIKARSIQQFGELSRHDGEEFIYVLDGEVTVHSDYYTPLTLSKGDSCYFDSAMGHACISGGEEEARVLWVCSHSSLA
ncbi:XRE family transcriptional regulator [Azospirillum sp. A26]|uniref:helix-turn-helix domain-containing protein n=1 Tax=Azospirillum sp. A26 TaxID=3160607 RepID=UPI003670EB5A